MKKKQQEDKSKKQQSQNKNKSPVKNCRRIKRRRKIQKVTKNSVQKHIGNIHAPKKTQKIETAKVHTKKNECKKRRNPHFIFTQKKKDQFYKALNQQYDQQLKVVETTDNKKEISNNKLVIFNEQIQVRQYENQQQVATFLSNVPILEQVNQQENKLDV